MTKLILGAVVLWCGWVAISIAADLFATKIVYGSWRQHMSLKFHLGMGTLYFSTLATLLILASLA